MTAGLRTLVDSLSIVNGAIQDPPSDSCAVEFSPLIPTRGGRGHLYVLVQTVGSFPDHAQIQQRITQVVQDYFRTSGSITAGLREAIKAANNDLFEANLNAHPEHRGIAGVTCLVLKDRDAYIAQLGPALLYQIGQGEFQRRPRESSWLSSASLLDVDIHKNPPLGLRREVEPELFHLFIRAGDVFVLASPSLLKLASDEQMTQAVRRRDAHGVRENLLALAAGRDVSALIVEVLAVEEAAEALPEVSGDAGARQAAKPLDRLSAAVRRTLRPAADTGPATSPGEALSRDLERVSSLGRDLRGAAESVGQLLAKMGRGLGTLLARILPESEPQRRLRKPAAATGRGVDAVRPRAGGAERRERLWLWAALLIPVLVVVLFGVTRYQHQRAEEAEFQRLLQSVQQDKASAETASSAVEQRSRLANAMAALDQAIEMKPTNEALQEEHRQISAWLDRINSVHRIFYFNSMAEIPDAGCQLHTLVIRGIDVYLLDLGLDRVYKYLLNDARDGLQALAGDPILLRKGDEHGSALVGELVDMAWVDASGLLGTSGLVVLDREGQTLEYDPLRGLTAVAPADVNGWREPTAVAGYFGRLYLLDPGANRLFRYTLTDTGYDGPPTDYALGEAAADLSKAIDVAIDGDVYFLHADGRITKYREGTAIPFPQTNLDQPLSAPTCVFVTGVMDEDGYVYVADAGNQRIVQFSKSGEFLRQFRSRDAGYMDDLRSLFVDDAAKLAYLISGNKLQQVTLP